MCTIIFSFRPDAQNPIIWGSNRDERLSRPASAPKIRTFGDTRAVTPLDEEAGGTWFGINEHGVLVGLTNRYSPLNDPERNSRGDLAVQALQTESAKDAIEAVAATEGRHYNPYHLIVADFANAYLCWSDGSRTSRHEYAPGLVVMTEQSLGASLDRRRNGLKHALANWGRNAPSAPDKLRQILSRPSESERSGACVCLEGIDYGSRSSTVVRLGASPLFLHADGPPCEAEYKDRTDLLEEIGPDWNRS